MLNRQRIILYMLEKAGGSASRIQLMQWTFLLRQETPSRGGSAFYDFLPYKYGPHSFQLDQDMGNQVKSGLVRAPDDKTWSLAEGSLVPPAPSQEILDAANVMHQYGEMSPQTLIDSVCSRFPWFTINCENPGRRMLERPTADPAVYTIGYQGLSIDFFLNFLLQSGITALADVRDTPWSRNYGFHRGTLSRLCESIGIQYWGFPQLGVPSGERTGVDSEQDRETLFCRYRERIPREQSQFLASLAEKVRDRATALLCMESDPSMCHRSQLANLVSERTNLPVAHLRGTS
ncbi:MAG: DUF488 domain-containing protein [Desulfomonile tiedjei]|nr:DUF488 domain-containing protein [Desulfomonile tiedjei]